MKISILLKLLFQLSPKEFAYGCNCNLLASGGTGDRPLTQAGWGQAIDSVDTVCKAYKDCQKCVEAEHGGDCIGENITYNYSFSSNQSNKAQCTDPAGSCKRALCECDSTFAFNQAGSVTAEYNPGYSHFFAAFDYRNICRKFFFRVLMFNILPFPYNI